MNYWKDKTILIISPESWGMNFVSKHHYAIELAKRGNKIYFLNPPQARDTCFEVKSIDGYESLFEINYPLTLRGLNKLPSFIADFINKFLVRKILETTSKLDVVWSFDPFRLQNLDLFGAGKKIYFSADPHDSGKEAIIARKADIVLTPSRLVAAKFYGLNCNVCNIGHGVSDIFFEQYDLNDELSLPGNNQLKVGYVGNLNYRFLAKKVLEEIVTSNRNIDFIFLGPLEKSNLSHVNTPTNTEFFRNLKKNANVFLLGQKPFSEIKRYLRKFDLLLSCYGEGADKILLASNHKTLEFLSSGKPIVSHYMDEYRDRKDLIQMAEEDNGDLAQVFSKTVENIKVFDNEESTLKRIAFAREHTYEKKLRKIKKLLNQSSRKMS